MQGNIIITNKDFPKAVLKNKTVILDSYTLIRALVRGNYYRRTHLVTCGACKTRLVTYSTLLTTRGTRSTRFYIRSTRLITLSTRFSTHSIRFSTRSARLSIRLSIGSTRLSTRSICMSTRSTRRTTCRSFYHRSL